MVRGARQMDQMPAYIPFNNWYNLETTASVDASPYDLGAVILQQQHDQRSRPIVSRALTTTEQRYSKKEAMAIRKPLPLVGRVSASITTCIFAWNTFPPCIFAWNTFSP